MSKPMSKMDKEQFSVWLLEGAQQLGLSLNPQQIDPFWTYMAEMQRWNEKMALTSITDEKEFIVKHLLDSIALIRWFPSHTSVADVGSGAGLPGIALKIMEPSLRLYLIESQKKKSNFLRHIVRQLELDNTVVLNNRLEDLEIQSQFHKTLDRVTARALGPLNQWIPLALPLLREKGRIVWILGRSWQQEVDSQRGNFPKWGIEIEDLQSFSLPWKMGERGVALLKLL
ncbi:MAG: 16S rRNA (guanine(527)-N(7))-methyltransferase RsmG [Deltaproteobacteria bacterium]|nr:16S rRNA (guanine(527)-N(7))-methyltransferase RsmG [Deltaproteobacteria bacterium]